MSYYSQSPSYAYWSRAYAAGPGNPNCFKKPDGNWVWHEVGKPGCGWSKVSCQAARAACLKVSGKPTSGGKKTEEIPNPLYGSIAELPDLIGGMFSEYYSPKLQTPAEKGGV